MNSLENTKQLADKIRRHVIKMTHKGKASHVASALSIADLLSVMYGLVLNVSPDSVRDPNRDRLILSKGHACTALYGALAEKGFFPVEWLDTFYQNSGRLFGHATLGTPGVEFSTGSLGHGLPVSCGLALAGKHDGLSYRVFTILSDGECDEGSVWEAALFAAQHNLDNLIAIIDYNKMQALGPTVEIIDLSPLNEKWSAFGWEVLEIDGHDHMAIQTAFDQIPFCPNKPSCLITHTVKGKGVSFMENKLEWHYKSPNSKEVELALNELA